MLPMMIIEIIVLGEYPHVVTLDDRLVTPVKSRTVAFARKSVCDTSQCIRPEIVARGNVYLYVKCDKYVDLCRPIGAVTWTALPW